MTFVSGTFVFLLLWWVVLFMVLPFGVSIDENPGKGWATSAPQHPHLLKKFLITTAITAALWALVDFVMQNDLVIFS